MPNGQPVPSPVPAPDEVSLDVLPGGDPLAGSVFERPIPETDKGVAEPVLPEAVDELLLETALSVPIARTGTIVTGITKNLLRNVPEKLAKRTAFTLGAAAAVGAGTGLRSLANLTEADLDNATLTSSVFDIVDFALGKPVRAAVDRIVAGPVTGQTETILRLAGRKGTAGLTNKKVDDIIKQGFLDEDTAKLLNTFQESITKQAPELIAGELGVMASETLSERAIARNFRPKLPLLRQLRVFEVENVGQLLENNRTAIQELGDKRTRDALRLDETIRADLPPEAISPVAEARLVPTERAAREIEVTTPVAFREGVPAGVVTLETIAPFLKNAEQRITSLRRVKGVPVVSDMADTLEETLKGFKQTIKDNGGFLLPSDVMELKTSYNEIRRAFLDEFSSRVQGVVNVGDKAKVEGAAEVFQDITRGLKASLSKSFGDTKTLGGVDVEEFLKLDDELSARFSLNEVVTKLDEQIRRGLARVPAGRIGQPAGTAPAATFFTPGVGARVTLPSGLVSKITGQREQFVDPDLLATFERQVGAPEDVLRNIADIEALEALPATAKAPTILETVPGRAAELGAFAGTNILEQLVEPGVAQAQTPITGPEDIFQTPIPTPGQDILTGPGDFLPPEVVAPQPAPLPPPILPRNTKDFFDTVIPEMLPGDFSGQLESLLASGEPSEEQKRQFIADIAAKFPDRLEPSTVPGFKSVIDNKVMDPVERELYRAEVISRIEDPGERILAKSKFNKDFFVIGKTKAPRRTAKKPAEVGEGTKKDTAEDRLSGSDERVSNYPF